MPDLAEQTRLLATARRGAAQRGAADERPSELSAADEKEEREHGPGQRAVHVLELGHQGPARIASFEMLLDG